VLGTLKLSNSIEDNPQNRCRIWRPTASVDLHRLARNRTSECRLCGATGGHKCNEIPRFSGVSGNTGLIACIFSGLEVSTRWGTFFVCEHPGSPQAADACGA
jgi:hypothetical protein